MSSSQQTRTAQADLIDRVVGIAPGDRLDQIRGTRPVARAEIQAAEEALFEQKGSDIGRASRWLVGAFVTALTVPGSALDDYRRDQLDEPSRVLLAHLLDAAPRTGPHGTYRELGLAPESDPVEFWSVPDPHRVELGGPLSAVIEHAHFLVTHPRDARTEVLARFVAAGWTRPQVVTWSQLISFVSFQTRVVHGLEVVKTHLGKESVS